MTKKRRPPTAKDNLGIAYKVAQKFVFNNAIPVVDSDEFSDAYVGLIKAENSFNPEKGEFSTYAYSLCRNEIIYSWKKRKRHMHETLEDDFEIIDDESNCLNEVEKRRLLGLLLEGVEFNDRTKLILLGYFCKGKTLQEVGNFHSLSKERIRQLILKAVNSIRNRKKALISDFEEYII